MKKIILGSAFAVAALFSASNSNVALALPQAGKVFVKICNDGSMAGSGSGACPANPAQGTRPNEWGCTLDVTTQLLWEIKTPTGLTDFRSRFSNVTASPTGQLGGGATPTANQINGATNSMGYVNALNVQRLCGRANWGRPSLSQLQSAATWGVSPQLPVAFFPDLGFVGSMTQHGPTLTSTQSATGTTKYQSFQISSGAVMQTSRIGPSYARLVVRWNNGQPCDGEGQRRCPPNGGSNGGG